MHNILQKIITQKKKDLLQKRNMSFLSAIQQTKDVAIIGEVKFASPTNPHMGVVSDLIIKAKEYEQSGISAISVITEKHFFKGDPTFISQVQQYVRVPILQKDFVIDISQIYEAMYLRSDALLLIARIIDTPTLQQFVSLAKKLGIEPIVEIASEEDLTKALRTETSVIAVNSRDLDTFVIDIDRACRLMGKIPGQFIRLGFSGINSAEEVKKYKKAGAKAILIGTALMRAKNTKSFVKELLQ